MKRCRQLKRDGIGGRNRYWRRRSHSRSNSESELRLIAALWALSQQCSSPRQSLGVLCLQRGDGGLKLFRLDGTEMNPRHHAMSVHKHALGNTLEAEDP
jgi:hypothetical protein